MEILDASPDRRDPPSDPACGGLAYGHVAYARQRQLKGEIVVDAFRRLGQLRLDPPDVVPSPETGYRLRARLHVRDRRAGFFLEGTHTLCDAAATGQLLPESMPPIRALLDQLGPRADACEAIVVSENVTANQRVAHLEPREGARVHRDLGQVTLPAGLTGVTAGRTDQAAVQLAGTPVLSETAAELFGGDSPVGDVPVWTRQAQSFFQGNRYLTGSLVRRVLAVSPGDRIVDLYAGVGLFSVALAARGSDVVAVEGDPSSGADLEANAAPWQDRLHVLCTSVEDAVRDGPDEAPDVVIVDPPRTGLSAEAAAGISQWAAARIVYVSCNPPTLARDSAKLTSAGYTLDSIEAFDLFPNTPHVESIAVFLRSGVKSA